MGLYFTQFAILDDHGPASGMTTATSFYARDYAHALETAELRRLHEIVVRPPLPKPGSVKINEGPIETPSNLIRQQRYAEAMHAAVYMGFLACASGVADGYELMHDVGPIHELSHILLYEEWQANHGQQPRYSQAYKNTIADQFEKLEVRIPGFHPSWSGVKEPPAFSFAQRLERARQGITEDFYATDLPAGTPRAIYA